MKLDLAYHRPSSIERAGSGLAIALAPNLRRDRVSFDGVLREPLRFREAMSALHDIVVQVTCVTSRATNLLMKRTRPQSRSDCQRYELERRRVNEKN